VALRQDPNLQQMHAFTARGIDFAMQHSRSCAHALHLAGANDGAGPHAVAMLELALEDISHDFHIAVAVRPEAASRLDPVLVDHPQRPEAHEFGVVIVREREGMIGIEPAVIEMASFLRLPNLNHMNVASITTNTSAFR